MKYMIKGLAAMVMIVLCAVLSGCDRGAESRIVDLEKRVAVLERQLVTIERQMMFSHRMPGMADHRSVHPSGGSQQQNNLRRDKQSVPSAVPIEERKKLKAEIRERLEAQREKARQKHHQEAKPAESRKDS